MLPLAIVLNNLVWLVGLLLVRRYYLKLLGKAADALDKIYTMLKDGKLSWVHVPEVGAVLSDLRMVVKRRKN